MVYRNLLLAKEYLNFLQVQEIIKIHLCEYPEKQRQKMAVRKRQMTIGAKRSDQNYLSLAPASTVLAPRDLPIQVRSKVITKKKKIKENQVMLGTTLSETFLDIQRKKKLCMCVSLQITVNY